MKTVQFKGSSYEVPDWTKWMAMDNDGEVYAYSNKPWRKDYSWYAEGGDWQNVGSVDLIEVG